MEFTSHLLREVAKPVINDKTKKVYNFTNWELNSIIELPQILFPA